MHWLINTKKVYWTNYTLGFVRTRITCWRRRTRKILFKNIKYVRTYYVAKKNVERH